MSHERTGFSRTVSAAVWLISLSAMACAVATEPEVDDNAPSGGKASSAGSPSSAGKSSAGGVPSAAFGGTSSTGGTTSTSMGGASSVSGSTSIAGKASSGGKGGSSSSGGSSSTGGAAGASSTGGTSTSAGAGPTGCGANVKAWKNADPNLTIAEGEVVQWMGKRYKATQAIAYPNTECAPDKPVDWCKDWFTPDGDC